MTLFTWFINMFMLYKHTLEIDEEKKNVFQSTLVGKNMKIIWNFSKPMKAQLHLYSNPVQYQHTLLIAQGLSNCTLE